MKKNIGGRKSTKSLMEQINTVNGSNMFFCRTFLFLEFVSHRDKGFFSKDRELNDSYDKCIKALLNLHLLMYQRERNQTQMQLVDEISDIYSDYLADKVNFNHMKVRVKRSCESYRISSKLNTTKLVLRKDKIKNLLGSKRAAMVVLADSFNMSRSQIEYNYRKAKNRKKFEYVYRFTDFNFWGSFEFLFESLMNIYDLKPNAILRSIAKKIYNYHAKELSMQYDRRNSILWEDIRQTLNEINSGKKTNQLVRR